MIRTIRTVWQWLVQPGDTLGNRTLNAGVWAFALRISIRGLRTGRTIILARLLAPEDFGLMGIALLTLNLLAQTTATGFDQALIQRKGDITSHLNTAWTVSVVRGLVLGSILALAAPLVAAFFATPEAIPIVRVLALSLVAGGFKNIGVVYFDKELEFRQRFVFRSVPQLFDLVIAVSAAVALRSVWALVFGVLARHLTETVGSYIAHPYRPRFAFDRQKAGDLVRFGMWVFANGILGYLFLNLDDIFVGRLLGAKQLGFYTMAFTLSALVSQEVTGVINQVAFPAYSKLQDKPDRLRNAYLRTIQLVFLTSFPLAAGLWFLAPVAVEALMGAKWIPLLPAFEVLLLWGLLRSVGATTAPLLKALGRPDINTKSNLILVFLLSAAIYPLTVYGGIVGAAWATVFAGVIPVVVVMRIAGRHISLDRWAITKLLSVPIVSSGIMLGALTGIEHLSSNLVELWALVWAPPIGMVVYAACIFFAGRFLGYALPSLSTGKTN